MNIESSSFFMIEQATEMCSAIEGFIFQHSAFKIGYSIFFSSRLVNTCCPHQY